MFGFYFVKKKLSRIQRVIEVLLSSVLYFIQIQRSYFLSLLCNIFWSNNFHYFKKAGSSFINIKWLIIIPFNSFLLWFSFYLTLILNGNYSDMMVSFFWYIFSFQHFFQRFCFTFIKGMTLFLWILKWVLLWEILIRLYLLFCIMIYLNFCHLSFSSQAFA